MHISKNLITAQSRSVAVPENISKRHVQAPLLTQLYASQQSKTHPRPCDYVSLKHVYVSIQNHRKIINDMEIHIKMDDKHIMFPTPQQALPTQL